MQLLEDIKTNIDSLSEDDELDPYFIGSIVVFSNQPRHRGKYLLIDGQQRMTTIFLLLCAIKARLHELHEDIPNVLSSDLRDVEQDRDGNETDTFRIELNYGKNQRLLEEAYYGKLSSKSLTQATQSEKNIISAYNCIDEYLKDEFASGDDLKRFVARVRFDVGLVRIETDDLQKALVVFETLNDRGVGLDAFDLLKNLLYSRTVGAQNTKQLTEIWESIKQNLDKKGIKPLRFLRYFIVSIDKSLRGKPPTEKSAFSWFQKKENRKNYQIDRDSIGFAEKIKISSGHYKRVLFDSIDHRGARSSALDSLNCLAGSSARQHMGLLLTAMRQDCSSEQFDSIAHCIESALFYSFATKLRSQELESFIANWTSNLQDIELFSQNSIRAFQSRVKSDLNDVYEDFYLKFDSFGQETVSQKYRQKYILAKYIQHSESQNKDSDYSFLSSIINENLEIEHVFPQNPSEEAKKEFKSKDQETEDASTGLLANLLLMEGSLQKSGSNKAYRIKREKYKNSKFWLVKKFADHSPDTTKVLQSALAQWPTHSTWTQDELHSRQSAYKDIARDIWDFGLKT